MEFCLFRYKYWLKICQQYNNWFLIQFEQLYTVSSVWKLFRVGLAIDSLCLFQFSRKIAHAHKSGRQNKNKLKEKYVESGEQLVNTHQGSYSVCTSFVSVDFVKKYAR